jgi:hypothetical protein
MAPHLAPTGVMARGLVVLLQRRRITGAAGPMTTCVPCSGDDLHDVSVCICPADVTIERVRELVGQDLPASLTLEYKEKYNSGLVKPVTAIANTYGGLILVGVDDEAGRTGWQVCRSRLRYRSSMLAMSSLSRRATGNHSCPTECRFRRPVHQIILPARLGRF